MGRATKNSVQKPYLKCSRPTKSKISWKMKQDFREEVEEKPKIRNFMDATLRFRCLCTENCEDKLLASKNKSIRTVLQGRENKKKRLLCRKREKERALTAAKGRTSARKEQCTEDQCESRRMMAQKSSRNHVGFCRPFTLEADQPIISLLPAHNQ